MTEQVKVKVVSGSDFSYRWEHYYVLLSDFEKIDPLDYEQQLYDLFEYQSFTFDELEHEVWEIE